MANSQRLKLFNKQNLAVLRQSPDLVVDYLLEVVDLFADGVEIYRNGVVVGDSLFANILDFVCLFAALNHLCHKVLNLCGAALDILNKYAVGL